MVEWGDKSLNNESNFKMNKCTVIVAGKSGSYKQQRSKYKKIDRWIDDEWDEVIKRWLTDQVWEVWSKAISSNITRFLWTTE